MPEPEIHSEEGKQVEHHGRSHMGTLDAAEQVSGEVGQQQQKESHVQQLPSIDRDYTYPSFKTSHSGHAAKSVGETHERVTDDAVHALTSLSEPFVLDKKSGTASISSESLGPPGVKDNSVEQILSSCSDSNNISNIYLPPPSSSSRQSPSTLYHYRTTATPSPTVVSSALSISSTSSYGSTSTTTIMRDLGDLSDASGSLPAPITGATRLPPLQPTLSSSTNSKHSPPARLQSLSVLLKDRLSLASLQASEHTSIRTSLPPFRPPTDAEGMAAQGSGSHDQFPSPAPSGADQDQLHNPLLQQQQQQQQHFHHQKQQAPHERPLFHQPEDPHHPLVRSLSSPTLHQRKAMSATHVPSLATEAVPDTRGSVGYEGQHCHLASGAATSSQYAEGMVAPRDSQRTTSPISFSSLSPKKQQIHHKYPSQPTVVPSTPSSTTSQSAPAITKRRSMVEELSLPHHHHPSAFSLEPQDQHHHHQSRPLTFETTTNFDKPKRKNSKRSMSAANTLSSFGALPPNALPVDLMTTKHTDGNELMLSDRGLLLKTQIPKKGRPITKHTSVATSVSTAHIITSPLPTNANAPSALAPGDRSKNPFVSSTADPHAQIHGRPRMYPSGAHQYHYHKTSLAAAGEEKAQQQQNQLMAQQHHQPVRRRPGRPPLSASLSSPILIRKDSSSTSSKASTYGDASHMPLRTIAGTMPPTRVRPLSLQITSLGRPPLSSPGFYASPPVASFDFVARRPPPPHHRPITSTTMASTGAITSTTEPYGSNTNNNYPYSPLEDRPPPSAGSDQRLSSISSYPAIPSQQQRQQQVESENSPVPSMFAEGHPTTLNTERNRMPPSHDSMAAPTPQTSGHRSDGGLVRSGHLYMDTHPQAPPHPLRLTFSPSSQNNRGPRNNNMTHLHSRSLDSLTVYDAPLQPIAAPPTSHPSQHHQQQRPTLPNTVQQQNQHENSRTTTSLRGSLCSSFVQHHHPSQEHYPDQSDAPHSSSSSTLWDRGVLPSSDSGHGPEWDTPPYDPRRATWSDPYTTHKEQLQQQQQQPHHQHHQYSSRQPPPPPFHPYDNRHPPPPPPMEGGNGGSEGCGPSLKKHEVLQRQLHGMMQEQHHQQRDRHWRPLGHEHAHPSATASGTVTPHHLPPSSPMSGTAMYHANHSQQPWEGANPRTSAHAPPPPHAPVTQGRRSSRTHPLDSETSGGGTQQPAGLSDSTQHHRRSSVSSTSSTSAPVSTKAGGSANSGNKRQHHDTKPYYPPILLRPVSLPPLHHYTNEAISSASEAATRESAIRNDSSGPLSNDHHQSQQQQHEGGPPRSNSNSLGGTGGGRRGSRNFSHLLGGGGGSIGGLYDPFLDASGHLPPPPPGQPLFMAHRAPSPSLVSSSSPPPLPPSAMLLQPPASTTSSQHPHPSSMELLTNSPPPLSATSTSSALSMQTEMTTSTSVSGIGIGSSPTTGATAGSTNSTNTAPLSFSTATTTINRKRKSGEVDSGGREGVELTRSLSSASMGRPSGMSTSLEHDNQDPNRPQHQYHHHSHQHYEEDDDRPYVLGRARGSGEHHDDHDGDGDHEENDNDDRGGVLPSAPGPKKKAAHHRHSLSQPILSLHPPHQHSYHHDTPTAPQQYYYPQQQSSEIATQQYQQQHHPHQPHQPQPQHHYQQQQQHTYHSTMVYPSPARPHPPYHG